MSTLDCSAEASANGKQQSCSDDRTQRQPTERDFGAGNHAAQTSRDVWDHMRAGSMNPGNNCGRSEASSGVLPNAGYGTDTSASHLPKVNFGPNETADQVVLTDVNGQHRVVRFDTQHAITEVDNPDGSSWVKQKDGGWLVNYRDGHHDVMLPNVKITMDADNTITVRNTGNGDNQVYREDGSKTYYIVNKDGTAIRRDFNEHGQQAPDVRVTATQANPEQSGGAPTDSNRQPAPEQSPEHPPDGPPESQSPNSNSADGGPLAWDPRLDQMHASWEHPQGLKPGDKYWKLVGAQFMPEGNAEGDSQGRHHIYYRVLDEQGQPINSAEIAQGWPDGHTTAQTKPEDGGIGNIAMYAGFDPGKGQAGPYDAWVTEGGLPSDKMKGMGLPLKHHVSYELTYQLATWSGDNNSSEPSKPPAEQQPSPQPDVPPQESGESRTQPHIVAPDGRRTDQHPDINLDFRGYESVNAPHQLVDYGGPTDGKAPQLAGLFGHEHGMPSITNTYTVNDWNWNSNTRGGPISDWPVSMIGLGSKPGEPIFVPNSGYRVDGQGDQAQVLYADSNSVVINYTANGWTPHGYTIHIEGIHPDPNLREGQFVKGWQELGTAEGSEVQVAIRDTGRFMDPRARKDWWHDNSQP